MKKTLFIHIGWHKTATSLIQLYLDSNREKLKKFDICYPVMDDRLEHSEIKHSYLYLSLLNKLKISHKQQELKVLEFDELFDLSIKEITDSGCRWAIISEEGLSEPNPGISKLLGQYKDHFDDIKIIAYIRRQDYFLESLYAQFVKQKPIRSSLYLSDYIKDPEVKKRADYGLILDWWADEFGEKNILVAPFEPRTISPDPITHFFKLTGLPAKILNKFPVEKKQAHVTPSREITEFFRYLNMTNTGFFDDVLIEYLMKSDAVLTNTKYFGRVDREKILQEYKSSNKKVANKYLNSDDGLLFKEPIVDFSNCSETWKGLKPLDVLGYALPVTGMMSHEIARLRYDVSGLQRKNSKLNTENMELRNENQRIAKVKKTIYRFLQNRYRKLAKKI